MRTKNTDYISNFAVKCFYAKLVNIIKRTVKK